MKLFEASTLGKIHLKNRVVMAPMTRSRALGNVPNNMMADYYGARASAGLIITEGTSPSPQGLGYPRIPGLFNAEQVVGWRKVTQRVHEQGGKIFVQLMHTGRVSHPANLPANAGMIAPSAIAVLGEMWTDSQGMQPHSVPREMNLTDIYKAIEEFVTSASLAIEAGFDGVELHAANGYLLEQFLNPASNLRTDQYGGSDEGRMRFVLEVADRVARKIGGDRLGIRISPYGVFNDMGAFAGIDQFYSKLVSRLSDLGLVYVHVGDHSSMGAPAVSQDLKNLIRKSFKGTYILSGGYEAHRAEVDLQENRGDLVAFGRPFLGNPDLVEKLKNRSPLKQVDPSKFYSPGADGYTQI